MKKYILALSAIILFSSTNKSICNQKHITKKQKSANQKEIAKYRSTQLKYLAWSVAIAFGATLINTVFSEQAHELLDTIEDYIQ